MKITTINTQSSLPHHKHSIRSTPIPKKHKRAVIKVLRSFEQLKKGKHYRVIFSDRLDSICFEYLHNNGLWEEDLREDLFEISGKDMFMWSLMDNGSYYFFGTYGFIKGFSQIVEESRRVLIEKFTQPD